MSIWHIFIAFSACVWLSGVTPAQQFASTIIGVSQSNDFIFSALEITQISVHNPTNVMRSYCFWQSVCANSVEPKVGLSIIRGFLFTPAFQTSFCISQPKVFLMQWTTGSF